MHVGNSDFYMDLLFYHVRLHCYVVVELKTEKFKPEFAGKLNFYVTAVNKQIKTGQDNPTISILICKDKDDVVTENALDLKQSLYCIFFCIKVKKSSFALDRCREKRYIR